MENPKMNGTARENLEEAIVAAYMEQYAKALDAGIEKTIEDCNREEFPPELDARCQALLQREYGKAKKKERTKRALRVLRSAAVVVLVMLSLCSVLFVSVEAFRIPIMNFYFEKTDRFLQISSKEHNEPIPMNFNPENPLEWIVPAPYTLTDVVGSWEERSMMARYEIGDEVSLFFSADDASGKLQVGFGDAVVSQIDIAGYDGQMYVEGERVSVVWVDDELGLVFCMIGEKISEAAMQSMAQDFAVLLETP